MHRILQTRRFGLGILLTLTLALRVLLPAGWMPAIGDGQYITICSGMGEARVWIDADGTVHKSSDGGTANNLGPCGFAAASAAFGLPGPAISLLPMLTAAVLLPIAVVYTIGLGLAAPPPPSIGPPTLH